VIGLADKHNAGALEAACAKAVTVGDPSYRTIKGILAAATERDAPPAAAGGGSAAAYLHGPASFANVIPMPGTVTSDAVSPASTREATHRPPLPLPTAAHGRRATRAEVVRHARGTLDAASPRPTPALFDALFAARTDMYAVRWETTRTGRLAAFRLCGAGGARASRMRTGKTCR
jgi:hypothetical protein